MPELEWLVGGVFAIVGFAAVVAMVMALIASLFGLDADWYDYAEYENDEESTVS